MCGNSTVSMSLYAVNYLLYLLNPCVAGITGYFHPPVIPNNSSEGRIIKSPLAKGGNPNYLLGVDRRWRRTGIVSPFGVVLTCGFTGTIFLPSLVLAISTSLYLVDKEPEY